MYICAHREYIYAYMIAIYFACLPPPVLGSACSDHWEFRRRDLVGVFSFVHRWKCEMLPTGMKRPLALLIAYQKVL